MKKLILITALFLSIITIQAQNPSYNQSQPIIFVEKGVEYAVFENGEFDFNILQTSRRNTNINVNITRNVGISFNTGRKYTQIHRNQFGDIININNTPINYNHRGQVSQIGNISIYYDRFGDIQQIGNLYVNYANNTCNYQGFVNRTNYHYRPVFTNYSRPFRHHHSYTYYGRAKQYRTNRYVNNNIIINQRNPQKFRKNQQRKNYSQKVRTTNKYNPQKNKSRVSERTYTYTDTSKSNRRR